MEKIVVVRVAVAAAMLASTQLGMAQTSAGRGDPLATQSNVSDLSVAVRGQYVLSLNSVPTRIAVGDPTVADIKLLSAGAGRPGQVMVIGKKPGLTRLQVWTRASATPQAWDVRVMSDVQQVLAARGLPGANNLDVAGQNAVISGQFDSATDHQDSVMAARGVAKPDAIADVSTVNTSSVVQVDVKVVEISRSTMKDIGINSTFGNGPWSIAAPFATNSATSFPAGSYFGLNYVTDKFTAGLSLLERDGLARVLAEPSLLSQSGQSASFLAGGEIPIPEAGGLGTQNVVYKPFGVGLSVTPTVLSKDRIALKVAPEASELDPANGIPVTNGDSTTIIPALKTRRADTTVELGDGETFIVSGLVSRQTKAQVNKVPFLGDLPIIGAFFRGVQYSQSDTELVFVVTPHLVRPLARGVNVPLPGGREEVSNRATTAWGYFLMGPASGDQMPGFSK
jgi:pilus assembly protein CpaC